MHSDLSRGACVIIGSLLVSQIAVTPAMGQQPATTARGCDELFQAPGVAWRGSNGTMTLEQLASYVAPVLWFSPDEPTLQRRSGQDIRMPTTLPFDQKADAPVIYYQVTAIDALPGEKAATVQTDRTNKAQSIVDFDTVTALRIKYIAYFPEESGVGQHVHDIEPTEVRVVVGRANGTLARDRGYMCDALDYLIVVIRVTGEAHGNPWYYNVLMVDTDTRLPIHMLVEEGKHGMATDKNADGYYTPGYDVSVRTNDAWGVRDTIRGGSLLSGKFEGWMAKVRRPEHRVLPPLPSDSPLRERLLNRSGEAPDNAAYELRPYPSSSLAKDRLLHRRWQKRRRELADRPIPRVRRADRRGDQRGARAQAVLSGLPLRRNGRLRRGVPAAHRQERVGALVGGYLVNRLYTSDKNLRDWGWMVMYTPSGSRWFDQYMAGGMDVNRFENDDGTTGKTRAFVLEAGIKLRFRAPNRVLGSITNFWGFRAGVKNVGAFDIDRFSYMIEIGAGVW